MFKPRALSLIGALLGLAPGCQQSDGFYCGDPLPGNGQVIQACTGPNEMCDCSTRSCVVSVDKKECQSGYKYTSVPFARQLFAERCVDEQLITDNRLIDQHEDDKKCPGSGSSSGTGGSAGSGAESSSTGTESASTSSGQGGAAGKGGTGGAGGAGGKGGMAGSGGAAGMMSSSGSGGSQ